MGAIEVCGNGKISSNASGFGVQEVNLNNSCGSLEHNSLWIKIEITTSGTLGFTLTPTNTAMEVDYDFFVFGPTVSCGNLGNSIRCSTTNPIAAGLLNNLTGMRDSETDLSEGPGPAGNSFVRSLDVQPGDTYYIVIDRPIGQSPFELEWTGTATTGGSPFPEGVEANQPQDLENCGTNGTAYFDVFQTRNEINTQPQATVEYYEALEDAIDLTNQITGIYTSYQSRKTIYARVENSVTGCYEIVEFDLIIPESPPVATAVNYEICDLDLNDTEHFELATQENQILNGLPANDHLISYYNSSAEAQADTNRLLSSGITSSGEEIFVRIEDKNNPGCVSISRLSLIVNTPATLSEITPEEIVVQVSSRSIDLDIINSENFLYALNDPSGPYQPGINFEDVNPGINILYIRGNEGCELMTFEILVPEYGAFFTPNGDGYNDHWNLNTGNFLNHENAIRIFDRYGKLLKEILPNEVGWDGIFNGKSMPADDYWFTFTLPSGQEIKDHFSLVR
ncbi:hypothetical protein GCM10007103_07170 [Salinimicrobium marinum]|uniref:Gliding motility-associated C-terminal domain-containing protein n=2 Tax=Salinimicrobium marinum TaxID=680283 RepID=A0A918VVY6_9FLAO|nr:hypothetical protein GCM10007103_07170 [Salinimicrobium marinum]